MSDAIESPCILVCSIDMATGFCHGCGRTRDEIGAWTLYSAEQRRRVHRRHGERDQRCQHHGQHQADASGRGIVGRGGPADHLGRQGRMVDAVRAIGRAMLALVREIGAVAIFAARGLAAPGFPATRLAERLVRQTNGGDANRHLIALQRISDRNGGNRAAPGDSADAPGYDESVDYVAGQLRRAGFVVTTPAFSYDHRVVDAESLTVAGAGVGTTRPASPTSERTSRLIVTSVRPPECTTNAFSVGTVRLDPSRTNIPPHAQASAVGSAKRPVTVVSTAASTRRSTCLVANLISAPVVSLS